MKENLERKVLEQNVIIRAMAGTKRLLERKVACWRVENKLQQKMNEKLMGIKDGDKTVVRRRIARMAKSVSIPLVTVVMCMCGSIAKVCCGGSQN